MNYYVLARLQNKQIFNRTKLHCYSLYVKIDQASDDIKNGKHVRDAALRKTSFCKQLDELDVELERIHADDDLYLYLIEMNRVDLGECTRKLDMLEKL